MDLVVEIDGRFVDPKDTHVAIDDRGYLLGDGIFATMRAYDGVCFRAREHLDILARGAALHGIPFAENGVAERADAAARRTGAPAAYVRVTLTRGAPSPRLSILAREMDVPTEDAYRDGASAAIVDLRRIPAACLDPTIKTTSYAAPILARHKAASHGAALALQLTLDGDVACEAMGNVFAVVAGALVTPPEASGCRMGVTRRAVLAVAREAGLAAREERFAPSLLFEADEVFVTSTRVECLPLASIDGRAVGRAGHPGTTAVRAALRRLIDAETRIGR